MGLFLSDYYLFLSVTNDFVGEKCMSREDYENRLYQFFAHKDNDFYESDLMK